MDTISIEGRQLEYLRLRSAHPRAAAPPMVFLHEGLGSVSMWRGFPQQVADATGCEAVVYSRAGYGRSDPAPMPRDAGYMHHEGLAVLPALVRALGLERPILFGHSDGGSIALICAGGTDLALSGVIVMAPHWMVEEVALQNIAKARDAWLETDLPQRLARYHRDPEAAFRGWNDTWLSPAFRHWNIADYLARIRVPVLAIQGEEDEYATMEQIDGIARVLPGTERVRLADCRHSPHRDQSAAVIAAVAGFVTQLLDGDPAPGLDALLD